MPSKSHTEFEYRYQVAGETIWEKIKILSGFLDGRRRAACLEEAGAKKYQAKLEKLKWLKATTNLSHEILEIEAEIIEADSFAAEGKILYEMNREEIAMLERLLAEAYAAAEPTRIPGYSDEEMFEANAANEFTAMIGKEIHAEIIANGRPSPAKIRNAMSNPVTWSALVAAGLIPAGNTVLLCSDNPRQVQISLAAPPT